MHNYESDLIRALVNYIDYTIDSKIAASKRLEIPVDLVPVTEKKKGLGTMSKTENIYPDLFKKYMDVFPSDRRKERSKAFTAWKKLSVENRQLIIVAAQNYVNEKILSDGNSRFIKYPERFIKHGTWEDYIKGNHKVNWMKEVLDDFSNQYLQKCDIPFIWNQNSRHEATELISVLGEEESKRRIWLFFSDKNMKIRDTCREKGYGWYTFKILGDTLLKTDTREPPVPCKLCGNVGSHKMDCPVFAERIRAEKKELEEVEQGREQNISMTELFKKIREEKQNVDS